MLVENQMIEMQWSNNVKQYYIDKGYNYTFMRDTFFVRAEDLSPKSSKTIQVRCDKCGKIKKTSNCNRIKHRKYNLDLCCRCSKEVEKSLDVGERAVAQFEKLYKKAEELGYTILQDESEYKNMKTKIKYLCPKHGVKEATVQNFLRGVVCYECGLERTIASLKLSKDELERRVNVNGCTLLNSEDYIGCDVSNMRIRCQCGNEWTTSLVGYMQSRRMCRQCSRRESSGEEMIRNVLDNFSINHIPEHSFPDCRDEKPLHFDFYLPELNCCIEFDGEQHYRPAFGEKAFEKANRHDQMKNEYCKNNNIKLIRIPYWEQDNIEDILVESLDLDRGMYGNFKSRIKIRFK